MHLSGVELISQKLMKILITGAFHTHIQSTTFSFNTLKRGRETEQQTLPLTAE